MISNLTQATLIIPPIVIAVYAAGLVVVFLLTLILAGPLKKVLNIILRVLISFVIIYLINLIFSGIFCIGLNFYTAVTIGLLGLPGLILILILNFII